MPFRVSGKNIEVGEALRERIRARILEALETSMAAFPAMSPSARRPFGFHTERAVHLDLGIVPRADCWRRSYLSADQAAEIWRSGCGAIIAA